MERPSKFVIMLLRLFHSLIDLFSTFLFRLVYWTPNNEPLPPIRNLILMDTATSLAHKIRTKKVRSEDVVASFINRIKEINPILNCVVDQRFEEALREAREVDEFLEKTNKDEQTVMEETPFLGVPFTTKDSIAIKDLHNTAGLLAWKDQVATEDADVVQCLRQAGAIPLCVTNVSELCMWLESANNVYGRTRNAYDRNHIVGGSSGGEGCLHSAAGSAMGVGSDIGGSIRLPSFFNGIFGHKPTTGIVSNAGQLPEATGDLNKFLVTGPMCRYATDLAPLLRVMAAGNVSKLKLDNKVDIKKLKYFYMEDNGGFPLTSPVCAEVKTTIQNVVQHLEKAYGIQAHKFHLKKIIHSFEMWCAKMDSVAEAPSFGQEMMERKGDLNVWLELVKWSLWMSPHTLPAIGLAITEKFGYPPGSDQSVRLCNMCDDLMREFEELLGDDGVFLYPTFPYPAQFHNQPIFTPFNFSYTGIFNVLGLPVTQCPLGLSSKGLPLGLQVVGSYYQDHLTIAVAEELERSFGGWVCPSEVQ